MGLFNKLLTEKGKFMNENLKINVSKIFGENVFDDTAMQERLPKKVYTKLHQIIAEGGELDAETADVIAHEMTHKFSFQKEHNSKISTLLGEVPSITMELFLEEYLLNNTHYDKNEILININNEFKHGKKKQAL